MKNPCRGKRFFGFAIVLAGICAPLICHAGGKVAAWGDNQYGQTSLPNGLNNVKAIAAGWRHNLALHTDGTVIAWGYSSTSGGEKAPPGLTNVTAISARGGFSLALKADGTVVHWGTSPSTASLSNISAIAAGWYHWVALKSDGTLVTASLGSASYTPTNIPPGLSNVTAIAAGTEYSVALKSDGTVAAWGWNVYGQTNVPPGLSNVVSIATGLYHSLALKDDGTVVTWGAIGEGVPPGLSNVVAIAAGARHSLALKADGSVVAWWAANIGYPNNGQINVPSGLSNVKAIAAGDTHNLALVFDGPPEIVEQPEGTEVAHQSNVALSVVARGIAPLNYRWLLNGIPLNDTARVSGTTTASLNISNAQFADTGNYTVIVSNALGSVTSTGAVLTVIGAPTILQQPVNRTVRAGTNMSFTIVASGTPPLHYQWNFNGTNISGATNANLIFTNVQPVASGTYFATVTNPYGTAQTVAATLTVTNSAPYILVQPTNQTTSLGSNASFTVSASGSKPLSYQWRFNGANIPNATNTTLTLSNLQYGQTGFYTVGVSNAFGETHSVKAFLNVAQLRVWGTAFEGSTNMPAGLTNVIAVAAGDSHIVFLKDDGTVKVWPANATVINASVTNIPASATNVIAIAAGSDQTLALRSNGTVVTWGYYGSNGIPFGLSNVISISASSSRGYAVKADGTAVAWGAQPLLPAGLSNLVKISSSTSHHLALKRDGSVIAWATAGTPAYLTNLSGLSNVVNIAAGRGGNLALRKDGTVWVSPGSRLLLPTNLFNRVAIAAGNSASMTLKEDGTVAASGSFGRDQFPLLSNATAIAIGGLTDFGVVLSGNGAPALTLNPYSQIVSKGDVVQLHARAAGVQPMSYQWQIENQDIPGATNSSLIFTNMDGRHTGNYRMLASNALGSTFSATARLSMPFSTNLPAALNATNLVWSAGLTNINPTNAIWFAQIQETHDGEVAAQSGTISHNQQIPLTTQVSGPGFLTFWWKVSSEAGSDFLRFNLDNESQPRASISGETGWEQKTFSIPAGIHRLRWTYIKDGTVSSGQDAGWLDEVIFTRPVPTIIRHPFDQTVSVGANVTIPAIAESSTQMSYQWLKNGTNLPGATAQYLTLTNVAANDAGSYTLKVSNLYGSVASSNAILTVLVPPQLNSFQVLPDGSTRFLLGGTEGGSMFPENMDAFEVQASTNVKDWITLPITPVLTNGTLRFDDTNSKNFPMRFYRIVEH